MNLGTKIELELMESLLKAGCQVKRSNSFFDHLKVDCFLENTDGEELQITAVQITTWIGKADKFVAWANLMRSCMYSDFCLYIEIDSNIKKISEQIGKALFKVIKEDIWNSNNKFHVLRVYNDKIEILNFDSYYETMLRTLQTSSKNSISFKDDFDQTFLKGANLWS